MGVQQWLMCEDHWEYLLSEALEWLLFPQECTAPISAAAGAASPGRGSSGCCWSLAVMSHLPSLRTLFSNEPLSLRVLGAAEPDLQPF